MNFSFKGKKDLRVWKQAEVAKSSTTGKIERVAN